MTTGIRLLMAVMGLATVSTAAMAADLGPSLKDTRNEVVTDYGRGWMIRGRAIAVIPDEDWGANPYALPGLKIDNSVVPEIDVTYFFNKNFAVELMAAVTEHNIKAGGLNVGDAWLLPPTLTLQYHCDLGRGIKPYVGGGVNYTVFFNEDAKNVASFDLKNNWGWVAQAGVDVHLRDNWFLNADVKKLWLDSDITVGGADYGTAKIDPWIVGVGLGYRFGGYEGPLK